ncbi:MAG: antibiotic biosynthesis monooxygenase [Chloroflexi bacterium]|nr:antibiotic biosynthesis monooxygenase [Chloroflexota bacterium]
MADHVTLFRMKAQAGKRQAVIDQFAKWEREHKATVRGFRHSLLLANNDDPDELMAAVRFDSTESYNANSDRAEQGAWFQELRALLAADPEWFNGTLVREAAG